MRKGLSSPNGKEPPLYGCIVNVYVADAQAFARLQARIASA